jgi:hypothetical protein|tara:strand:+ start:772 stop:1200 length:429 start_codon:yes stop_codon:yes gene_type:complete
MEGTDPFQIDSRRINMTTANSKYSFDINSEDVSVLAAHPKSGLAKVVVSGVCTNADGVSFDFVATNNLDQRYPERFKVNWNGSKARMPEVVGFGIADDVRGARSVSEDLYFTRGARIAIAKRCLAVFPLWKQQGLEAAAETE